MPHLASIAYTHRDQMRHANLRGGGDAYYAYDASGERVRKVIQRIGTTREERIYLGGFEIYRKRTGASQEVVLERETLHVMDGTRRIALLETKTVDAEVPGTLAVVPRLRFQYGNHFDSAMLECDEEGRVISYEEYHPYGTAAYRSARAGVEVSERRYRYTGKERDEETGLYYHGARYYTPWFGRWTSADPAGIEADGPNLYAYVRGNPIRLHDPSGRESATDKQIAQMTDVQLHRHLKTLTEEGRAEFRASATGQFKERVVASLAQGKLEAVRTGVTKVEHVRPEPKEATPPTYWAPGRLHSPDATFEVPGTSSGDAAERMPDPVAKAVYKYLTEENPTAGAIAEGIQSLGGVVLLTMDARAILSGRYLDQRLSLSRGNTSTAAGPDGETVTQAMKNPTTISRGARVAVASIGAGEVPPATIVREIQHGERVRDIVSEVGTLTEKTNMEHGVISLASGKRVIVSGGTEGIDLGALDIRRILLHSHPPDSPPGHSDEDIAVISYFFQRSSWLLEVEEGVAPKLSRFRVGAQ